MWFSKKKNNDKIIISDADRQWVNDEFYELLLRFGYPKEEWVQFNFSVAFFPDTFSHHQISIDNLIEDLIYLIDIKNDNISYEVISDIKSSGKIPYMIKGKVFETQTIFNEDNSHIFVAKSLLKQPNRLIFNLVYEIIKIKMQDKGLLRKDRPETYYQIFIVGTFFGFGLILSQNLINIGRKSDSFWETQWNYNSLMPSPIMAYTLALFSELNNNTQPDWINQLPKDISKEYQKCTQYLSKHKIDYIDINRYKSLELEREARRLSKQHQYEQAISKLTEALQLTDHGKYQAGFYVDIGYYYILSNQLDYAEINLNKALEIFPSSPYANNNMGYVLIRKEKLEEGKAFLDKVTNSKDPIIVSYLHRDLGVYYLKKNNLDKAKEHFDIAFSFTDINVDSLNFHYAEYLLQIGNKEEAIKHLQISADNNEILGKKLLKKLSK